MSLIDRVCKTCQYRKQPALYTPCVNCTDHDKWEVSEMVTVRSKKLEFMQQENERLKGAIQEWIDGVCISQKYLSQIGKLQQENEQLCEKLEKCADEFGTLTWENVGEQQKNKQLREVLGNARETLFKIRMDDWPGMDEVQKSLTAIDEVMKG